MPPPVPMADAAGAMAPKTSLALSNLRAFVILLVIAFHSVLAYLGSQPATQPPFDLPPYDWRAIPLIDHQRWFGFDLFCAFQYIFLMPFMFFLSGLFVWPSLQRKGRWRFLIDRCWRLGVPFLLGVYLLMPIAHYPVYRASTADPSWAGYWKEWMALPFSPSGPLWFLWQLLFLNIAAVAIGWLCPGLVEKLYRRCSASPGKFFVGLLVVSTIAYVPLAHFFRPWDLAQYGPFAYQPGRLLHYIVYFAAGLGVGAHGLNASLLRSEGMLRRHWAYWIAATAASFVLWLIVTALTLRPDASAGLRLLAELVFALSSATACLGFAAIFLRFAERPWPGFSNLSKNAYGLYLIHYAFVIWLQSFLLDLSLPAIVKGATVFTGTLILSLLTVNLFWSIPISAWLLQGRHRGA